MLLYLFKKLNLNLKCIHKEKNYVSKTNFIQDYSMNNNTYLIISNLNIKITINFNLYNSFAISNIVCILINKT